MKKIKWELIFIVILIILLALCFFIFSGCTSPPEILKNKKDETIESYACFKARYCGWENRKNKDKTSCVDDNKECRAYNRFEYCKDPQNLPVDKSGDKMKFQTCWDKLNSK
ncbi:hypothetical protein KAR91_53830 [Candidatus Pacearchaeota archaeon]|nr:hypothetical protein [Candidatus Pacearchaeota archaeon]